MSPEAKAMLPGEVAAIIRRYASPLRVVAAKAVDGASQVTVWRVALTGTERRDIAVRVVRRPVDLLERQAAAVEVAHAMDAPVARIIGVEPLNDLDDRRPAAVVLMEWVHGEHPRLPGGNATAVGKALARLHAGLRGLEDSFQDRPVKLDTHGGYVQQLRRAGVATGPLWRAIERHQKALRTWDEHYRPLVPQQLLHGDVHPGNVVVGRSGIRLIDFDKMMVGPRVFDLAKYIATSCFVVHREARFARQAADAFLTGYASIEPLTDTELASLIPLCMILNAETGLLGLSCGLSQLIDRAEAVAHWWVPKPGYGRLTKIRGLDQRSTSPGQLVLFRAN